MDASNLLECQVDPILLRFSLFDSLLHLIGIDISSFGATLHSWSYPSPKKRQPSLHRWVLVVLVETGPCGRPILRSYIYIYISLFFFVKSSQSYQRHVGQNTFLLLRLRSSVFLVHCKHLEILKKVPRPDLQFAARINRGKIWCSHSLQWSNRPKNGRTWENLQGVSRLLGTSHYDYICTRYVRVTYCPPQGQMVTGGHSS